MHEEVGIFDYIKIIIRERKTVFTVVLFSFVFTLIFTLATSTQYRGEIVIEIGNINGEYLEKTDLLAERIRHTNPHINIDYTSVTLPTEVSTIKNYPILKIKGESEDKQELEDNLNQVFKIISDRHNLIIEDREQYIEEELDRKTQRLASLQREIETITSLELYELRRREIIQTETEIKRLERTNTEETKVLSFDIAEKDKRLNINLILSLILGFFAGVFFVLIKDWWKNENEV